MQNLRTPALTISVLLALLAGACGDGGGGGELSASLDSPERPEATEPGSDGGDDGGSEGEAGGEVPSTTTPASGGSPEPAAEDAAFCDAAQRIRDLDDESTSVMNDVMKEALTSPEQAESRYLAALDELEALVPDLTDAYDDMEAAAPQDLKDDVDVVRAFTVSLMRQLTSMESLEDFADLTAALDTASAAAAGAATFEIDAATRSRCGITIAN